MKILFASASVLFSDHAPGGEIQISHAIVRAAVTMGHKAIVFAPKIDLMQNLPNCLPFAIGAYDFLKEHDYFKAKINWWKYALRCNLKARSLLKTSRVDIIHHILPCNKGKFSLCSRLGLPFIYGPVFSPWAAMKPEEYGDYSQRGSDIISTLKNKAVDRLNMTLGKMLWLRTLRDARFILVELQRTVRYIPEDYRHKVRVLSPGVDLNIFSPWPEPEGRQTILFLAVLARRKGLEFLLKAMVDVIKKRPDVLLLIAGDGPDKDFFISMARGLCLGGNLEFRGEVHHTEVPSLFKNSHIFCLPSLDEAYGMSALQAMACGRPVVATNAGGLPSLIEDGRSGILVSPKDHVSLAEAIAKLLSDGDLRRTLGEAGRKVVMENYSFKAMRERLEAIYQEALAQRVS